MPRVQSAVLLFTLILFLFNRPAAGRQGRRDVMAIGFDSFFSFFGSKFIQNNEGKKLKFYDIACTVYHLPRTVYDVNFFGGKGLEVKMVYVTGSCKLPKLFRHELAKHKARRKTGARLVATERQLGDYSTWVR